MLRAAIGFAAIVAFAATAVTASGHVSPSGCANDHSLFMDMSGLNEVKRNGDRISVAPTFGNTSVNACEITNGTVTVAFPNADGTKGPEVVVATGVNLPVGKTKTFSAATHTVRFDSGVFRGFVWIELKGVWHFEGHGPDPVSVGALGRPLVISRPHVTFGVGAVASGSSPFTVTYTYSAENDSPSDPAGEMSNPTPGAVGVEVADDSCSPVTFTGGDTTITVPPDLQKGETWTYECTRPLPAGSLVDIATFTGGSTRDGRAWPKRTVRHAWCGRLPATIVGTKRANKIVGTPGKDVIVARAGDDVVDGRGGADVICGGDGNDTLRGKGGNDELRGEAGADKLAGGRGVDKLVGGPGRDTRVQ
ncbi:MAG TPA: calcium-binding protein [Gaiellaceae bacterium]|nr:calcium-binding protein [Gaiellaceae bacterium]